MSNSFLKYSSSYNKTDYINSPVRGSSALMCNRNKTTEEEIRTVRMRSKQSFEAASNLLKLRSKKTVYISPLDKE